jgi:signal transduction histidine kinase/CheY-like chemotaxis protein
MRRRSATPGAAGTSGSLPPRLLLFVTAVAAWGAVVLARAAVAVHDTHFTIYFVPLVLLTIVSGRFAIEVPGRPATVSLSEVFVFTTLLLFGPAAATLTVALDGVWMSFMQKDRRVYRALFNVTEPAISVWLAGHVFFAIARIGPLARPHEGKPALLLATIGMTLVFFLLNSGLTALAVWLENGGSAWQVWSRDALHLAINYYAAASLATLAAANASGLDVQVVGLVVPLFILSYVAYKEAASRLDEAKRHVEEVERLYEEARKRDDKLRQAQKLEAIGRLAGGVAHDFNNVLSVILSHGELILQDLKPADPLRADIEEICKAASRAAGLTRQLLTFSRQQVIEPKVIDLHEVLMSMDSMLQRILGEDVELVSVAPKSSGRVKVDPSHIEQVILNLVVNARDAMPTGGKLTIETANVVLDESYAVTHLPAKAGPYVMMAVSDTGTGIDRATQTHIFEPFFTTKEKGKGTGLGLSTVFGIVQQSGGNIWVYSEPGKGTTFKVYLPRVDAEVDVTRPQVAPPTLYGTETVLLVEDEEQVRKIVLSILRRQGYRVIAAQHAGEALLLCEQHRGPIDLLLTDVVMPQMSGPQLAKRLASTRPEMKVLCMSGYTDDSIVRHGVLETGVAFIQKPVTPTSLAKKVREVLDAPAATKGGRGEPRVPN